ncbi:MAG: questin oxidase family protein [Gudongella sp.]|nr:questin oxidase family protein [Gudongella sp.]
MGIGSLVNQFGDEFSPYAGNLVNHLPMGQLAFYKMTNNLEDTLDYSQKYSKTTKIKPVKEDYIKADSIKECVGDRELYESCLALFQDEITIDNYNYSIFDTLNNYKLGMSSGLFHTLIRVAYAIEGLEIDKDYLPEVARALAYYITAYREAAVFESGIDRDRIIHEMDNLISNPNIKELLKENKGLGKRLKALYSDENYMKFGFVINGDSDEKINAILDLTITAYANTGDIVALHCITGLHALITLEKYWEDFPNALDIYITSVVSHLLTINELSLDEFQLREEYPSWEDIIDKGSKSSDVHTLKLAYSARELDKEYKHPGLKEIVIRRLEKDN